MCGIRRSGLHASGQLPIAFVRFQIEPAVQFDFVAAAVLGSAAVAR
jgi:hypothetical protein